LVWLVDFFFPPPRLDREYFLSGFMLRMMFFVRGFSRSFLGRYEVLRFFYLFFFPSWKPTFEVQNSVVFVWFSLLLIARQLTLSLKAMIVWLRSRPTPTLFLSPLLHFNDSLCLLLPSPRKFGGTLPSNASTVLLFVLPSSYLEAALFSSLEHCKRSSAACPTYDRPPPHVVKLSLDSPLPAFSFPDCASSIAGLFQSRFGPATASVSPFFLCRGCVGINTALAFSFRPDTELFLPPDP